MKPLRRTPRNPLKGVVPAARHALVEGGFCGTLGLPLSLELPCLLY